MFAYNFLLVVQWECLKIEPDLRELQNYICRVAVKWKHIGIQLEIQLHELDRIEVTHASHDLTMHSTEVLRTWQRKLRPPFTWATFIEVLTTECIGEHALAKQIVMEVLRKLQSY